MIQAGYKGNKQSIVTNLVWLCAVNEVKDALFQCIKALINSIRHQMEVSYLVN